MFFFTQTAAAAPSLERKTCCCSRSDILFLARRARAPLWRVPHAVIGETKEIHPRKAQVCAKTFLNTVPVLWRSMCHPTFQYIFFHFSIQACHRIWNLWIEPLNQGSNTESMVGSLRGTLQGTLFHSQPFAQVSNPTSMLTEQLRKFRNCSVSMDVKARPGSASMTPTIKGAKGKDAKDHCKDNPTNTKDNQKQLHDHLSSFQTSRWLHSPLACGLMFYKSQKTSDSCRTHCLCTASTAGTPEFRWPAQRPQKPPQPVLYLWHQKPHGNQGNRICWPPHLPHKRISKAKLGTPRPNTKERKDRWFRAPTQFLIQ